MAVLGSQRIAVRVCQMFYLEDMSQKEISLQLGISRPQVSRILAAAKRDNLVTIAINDPFARETELQNRIKARYQVEELFVFDTGSVTRENSLAEFGRMAAACIDLFIADQSTVGVMSGRTIDSLCQGVGNLPRRGLRFVPLVGGLGALNTDWHANSIAMAMAQKCGGMSYALNAPVVVREPGIRDAIIQEPEIAGVLQKGAACNTAILGIGAISENSTTSRAGGFAPEDIQDLQAAGAKASVCCSYLDENGAVLDIPFNNRCIGQTLQALKKSRTVALAIGKSKVGAIHSALASGYIKAFMTDVETAQLLLAYKNEPQT